MDALVTQVERSNGDNLLAQCFQTEEMKASGVGFFEDMGLVDAISPTLVRQADLLD